MTERLDWAHADDPQDVVHQAVELLYAGRTIVFPTAATYALVAYVDRPDALDRIRRAQPSDSWSPALALHDADACLDLAGSLGSAARRLIERSLPGPITMLVPFPSESDLFPTEASDLVVHQDKISVRVPAHQSILEALRLLPEPLLLLDGPSEASTAEGALKAFGDHADFIVDGGTTPFGRPTTVVDACGEEIKILREGVVPSGRIRRLTSEIITFVCTGNSCRSPMAEALFRKMLSDALGCAPEQLPEQGYIVQSAGLAAYDGAMASEHAQEIAREYGASLEDHVAQTLTPQMIQFSDRLVVMTRDHRLAIVSHWPEAAAKTFTLAGGADISDPIGGDAERYRRCAGQIATHLQPLIVDIKNRGSARPC